MFFGKKSNGKMRKCEECGSKSEEKFSFCPHCGNSFIDPRKEQEDFGLLGRNDYMDVDEESAIQNMGVFDKLVNSMVNSMMKNIDKQFKSQFKDIERGMDKAEVRAFPNGIKIKISGPFDAAARPKVAVKKPTQRASRKEVNESQLRRMGSLPRAKAKTNVKRFGNKVLYELSIPGVISVEDVFVSKLERGYEVKAIGDKKVYVNSVPINLPLRKYSVLNNKLQIEFVSEMPQPQGFD
ncbi:MAG: zinc ribbon domain-containing protein [Nanoarchaeota archaeon]|nr:zinc ribbon domain-containing protein [Nanoarchaeota archaeon]MBU0976980.1 zinc ribbon domain-containing protein [Nanoarchaeota archaeon]